MDGETNGGQEATQGTQDQAQQQGQSQVEAPDYEKQIAELFDNKLDGVYVSTAV